MRSENNIRKSISSDMPIALPRPRTSGQHDVVFDLVPPYSAFPQKVTGPTVWQAEDFRAKPELWKEQWTPEQIDDLERAYDSFRDSGRPITAISKVRIVAIAYDIHAKESSFTDVFRLRNAGYIPSLSQHH